MKIFLYWKSIFGIVIHDFVHFTVDTMPSIDRFHSSRHSVMTIRLIRSFINIFVTGEKWDIAGTLVMYGLGWGQRKGKTGISEVRSWQMVPYLSGL